MNLGLAVYIGVNFLPGERGDDPVFPVNFSKPVMLSNASPVSPAALMAPARAMLSAISAVRHPAALH